MASIVRDALGRPLRRKLLSRSRGLGLRIHVGVLGCHVRLEALERSPAPGALAGVDRLADLGQLALVGVAAPFGALVLSPLIHEQLPSTLTLCADVGELPLEALAFVHHPLVTERAVNSVTVELRLSVEVGRDGVADAAPTVVDDERAPICQRG